MSQIIYARRPFGIVIGCDSKVTVEHGVSFPRHFPKAFHVNGWIFVTAGIGQLQQILLNAVHRAEPPASIETFVRSEYQAYCAGAKGVARVDVENAARTGAWNPTLLVVDQCNEIRQYVDVGSNFTGQLRGTAAPGSTLVLGPTPADENQSTFSIRAKLGNLHTLTDLQNVVVAEIAKTAQVAESVGPPVLWITKDTGSGALSVGGQPDAYALNACYGNISASLVQWMELETLFRSQTASETEAR